MAAKAAAICALVGTAGAVNISPRNRVAFVDVSSSKNGAGMMPDVVAHSLVAVEDEWQAKAILFNECQTQGTQEARADCMDAKKSFGESCSKVVKATLEGSSGDRDDAHEYLEDVCAQNVLDQWHKDTCLGFTEAVAAAMTQDKYGNRAHMDVGHLCSGFWSKFLDTEAKRAEAEAKVRAEKEKIEAEAKAKADAEAKAKAEADAKAAAEEKAKRDADEAKAKAEAEAKAKAAAEAKAKAEQEAKAKADAEAKAKAQEQAKAKADAKAKSDAVQQAKKKTQAEVKVGVKADAKTQAERQVGAKATAEPKSMAK